MANDLSDVGKKRIGFQSGLNLGVGNTEKGGGRGETDFRITLFPIEATYLLGGNDSSDIDYAGNFFVRTALEGRFGAGKLDQIVDARFGITNFYASLEGHAGFNFSGKLDLGVELSFFNTTRLVLPGIVFGYDRVYTDKPVDVILFGLQWAYPYPNWAGYHGRLYGF